MKKRAELVSHDLDNDGALDGTETYSYDNAGRLTKIVYDYVTDDLPPINPGPTFGLGPGDHVVDYSYDVFDRVTALEVTFTDGLRTLTSYTWNADDLITQTLSESFESDGTVTTILSAEISYDGLTVTGWETKIAGGLILQDYAVSYDANGLPDIITLTRTSSGETSVQDIRYEWSEFGQILSVIEPFVTFLTTYDVAGRIETQTTIQDDETSVRRFFYDAQGLQIRQEIDRDNDGVIDGTLDNTWADGPCLPSMAWVSGALPNFVAAGNEPYIPGTGYLQINPCGPDL